VTYPAPGGFGLLNFEVLNGLPAGRGEPEWGFLFTHGICEQASSDQPLNLSLDFRGAGGHVICQVVSVYERTRLAPFVLGNGPQY